MVDILIHFNFKSENFEKDTESIITLTLMSCFTLLLVLNVDNLTNVG